MTMNATNINTFIETFNPAITAYQLYKEGINNSYELSGELDLILETLFYAGIINKTEYLKLNNEKRELIKRLPYEVTNV